MAVCVCGCLCLFLKVLRMRVKRDERSFHHWHVFLHEGRGVEKLVCFCVACEFSLVFAVLFCFAVDVITPSILHERRLSRSICMPL